MLRFLKSGAAVSKKSGAWAARSAVDGCVELVSGLGVDRGAHGGLRVFAEPSKWSSLRTVCSAVRAPRIARADCVRVRVWRSARACSETRAQIGHGWMTQPYAACLRWWRHMSVMCTTRRACELGGRLRAAAKKRPNAEACFRPAPLAHATPRSLAQAKINAEWAVRRWSRTLRTTLRVLPPTGHRSHRRQA